MRRPRPPTVVALLAGALALGLALWWISEVVEEPATSSDGADSIVPTWITAGDPRETPPATPALAPPVEADASGAPPGVEPVAPDVPEALTPPATEDDGEREFREEAPRRRKKRGERGVVSGSRSGLDRDWRSGSVGQTDATATREVYAPDGTAWIGTPLRWVQGLEQARGSSYRALLYEAPRHTVRMQPFYIDRFEAQNQEYLRYLQNAHAVTYDTSDHEPRTLVGIAIALIADPPANLDYEEGVARQLFQANLRQLLDVFKDSVVSDRDGVVDEEQTFLRIRDQLVPRGVQLSFYDAAPPPTWPSAAYKGGRGGYPVRGIAVEEALAFAHWEGHHIPSEIEWEYAARGPRGLDFPWDARGNDFDERVNGGTVLERDEEPDTLPVVSHPNGASWIGCFNMLGNVAEWTSSFLDPYPDAPPLGSPVPGRNVVVRGGSAQDEDPYLLRPAFRGWLEGRPLGGPRPRNRVPFTGFRTARYEAIGFSRTVGMHYAARRGQRLDPALLEPDIYDAWQGLQTERFERQFQDDLTRPGVKSLCVQPLRQVGVRSAGEARYRANTSPALVQPAALHELSASMPILVGMFQNDLHLVSTWHASASGGGQLFRARCPPGIWYVALFQSRLALLRPDFGDVFFVSNRPAPKAMFSVRELRTRPGGQSALPVSELGFRAGGEDVRVEYESQLLQEGTQTWVVHVSMRLAVDVKESAGVRNWEHGRRTEPRR